MLSVSKDSFTFSDLYTFLLFYCLILMTRISNIKLNKSDDSGQSCFLPNFLGNSQFINFKIDVSCRWDVCVFFCVKDTFYHIKGLPRWRYW